ncbi:alpha-ketoglutarate-dependent taurine dioxygenase [Eremomyces bilateralis CBS 781.70]|uniref:Alpha-ketoglutarate-dependent taurine dioxygenase n=1 Tax=Eremomyces bilateralis CBS 781.70 TaxID=1392243 RepID=A0A6G1FRF3_9PEZI|nr:alpha-ketoglutarate-dependent taurine dioxygenase [Eremomyces bilateralis CBS 781.70]KAF1808374.1 alpha-ketoglutarate-dependent taurine dioxygenase [Eremomyces bilateralis CBS 781.70]
MATVTSTETQNLPISVQADPQPTEEKAAEEKPTEEKAAEEKTAEEKAAEAKPKIRRAIDEEGDNAVPATYPHYLPVWDHGEKYPPLEPFEHIEKGKGADPTFKDLLTEGFKLQHLTPTTGSEVSGVQLSKLSDAGKDQLALLVAQRKVVAFRNQDLADLPPQEAVALGSHFGPLHIHPTGPTAEGHPELMIVHRTVNTSEYDLILGNRNSTVAWHSDVTYEKQPPATTFLYALDVPEVGGDTAFVNQVEAYNRLSPLFKERLHGLKAVHSGIEQVEFSKKREGIVKREGITSEHPLVRTHPATGEKALFVNKIFTRKIVGFKDEESEALLNFLYDHIGRGIDYQARVKWAPGTVVIWDNRVTSHSAIVDWTTGERRLLARITPQGEAPIETPYVAEPK